MIIDSHVHLGGSRIFDTIIDEENLISAMEKNNVDACVVQPLPGALPSSKEVHDKIFNLAKKYPKKIFGLVSINPHIPKKELKYEVERCIKELGFVGIKCHTIGHSVNPLSEDGDLIFNLANKLNIPINKHTGIDIAFAYPSLNIPKAKQYPELKIVLAHSGMGTLASEAYVAAKECTNIYLETSWTSAEDIEWFIKEVGSNRIMMGSDIFNNACYNQAVELKKYEVINIKDEDRINCLYKTAKEVFNLDI